MAAFAPKGDKSLRTIVLDMAAAAPYDRLFTYAELGEALNLDPDADRNRIRQAVTTARPGLLKRHQRALIADRGRGYRVARPGEFAGVAEAYRDRGARSIRKALAVIEHAPEPDMSPAELRRFRAVGLVIRNLNSRVSNTEQLLDDARQRLADLEDAVFGRPPATIQGTAEPVTEEPDGGGSRVADLEATVFGRKT